MEYLIWEIVILAFGMWAVSLGVRRLRQTDEEFLADVERTAREKIAKDQKEINVKRIQRWVTERKANANFWRTWGIGAGLGGGFVLLFTFIALVLYDLNT